MRPNIGNLRKRAKVLGMLITRGSTDEDARMFGGHEYVLHAPGADWENEHNNTLHIRRMDRLADSIRTSCV